MKEDISEDSELDISSESDDREGNEEQDNKRTENNTDAIAPRENAEEKFTVKKSREAFSVIIPKERYNDPDVFVAKKAELKSS